MPSLFVQNYAHEANLLWTAGCTLEQNRSEGVME